MFISAARSPSLTRRSVHQTSASLRYAAPVYGRFLQADPLGYDDGPNLYNYAGSDPVNFTDPSGTSRLDYMYERMAEDGNGGYASSAIRPGGLSFSGNGINTYVGESFNVRGFDGRVEKVWVSSGQSPRDAVLASMAQGGLGVNSSGL